MEAKSWMSVSFPHARSSAVSGKVSWSGVQRLVVGLRLSPVAYSSVRPALFQPARPTAAAGEGLSGPCWRILSGPFRPVVVERLDVRGFQLSMNLVANFGTGLVLGLQINQPTGRGRPAPAADAASS